MKMNGLIYDKNKYQLKVYDAPGDLVEPDDYQYLEKSDIDYLEIVGNQIIVYYYDKEWSERYDASMKDEKEEL